MKDASIQSSLDCAIYDCIYIYTVKPAQTYTGNTRMVYRIQFKVS